MPRKPALPATLVDVDESGQSQVRATTATRSPGRTGDARMPPRYADLGPLAEGGSGEVRRVHDQRVDRPLVMKILDWRHLDPPDNAVRRRFDNEAYVTASLEHPGVVPVYDRGTLPDGSPWFTMKEVRGETFAAALEAHAELPGEARGENRRRLVEALLRVAETVAYAHSRGVVHRDLKPANLMRGAFGQVYVMDWGVAKTGVDPATVAEALAETRAEAPKAPPPTDAGGHALTRHGDVLGTVPYMAPEQARGHTRCVGPASDVWALGLVLYEILAGRRAFRGSHVRIWAQVAAGSAPALPEGAAWPAVLRDVVAEATRADARERLPDAGRFAERLQGWLAGEARRERAAAMVAAADGLAARVSDLRAEEARAWAAAQALLSPLHANDPDEARWLAGWRAEDRAQAAHDAAWDAETEVLQLLRAALQHDPDHLEAHARFAALARDQVGLAEARGELREAKRWSRVLAEHDDGTHAGFLAGHGEVALASDPPGAEVTLHRFVHEDRRLVPRPLADAVVRAPFRRQLPAGSYLALFRAPGRHPARYPFTIEREACWEARVPEGAARRPVRLLPEGTLAEDECFVPGGWCLIGEPEARCESYARTRVWVDDLVVKRFPVRVREYAAYLQALLDAGDEEALAVAAPAKPSTQGWADLRRTSCGRIEIAPTGDLNPYVVGETPARLVSAAAAEAYAAWRASLEGRPWRLPTDVEWEKAARGVDGRCFPWGPTPVSRWAVTLDYDPPGLKSMEAAPRDESPYGVRHVAGNIHQFTATPWRLRPTLDERGRVVAYDPSETRELRTARGGSYTAELFPRVLPQRFAMNPGDRGWGVGFRLVRSLGPAAG